MIRLTAQRLTPCARAWLERQPRARVHSAYERACNLVDADGDLISLQTSLEGLAPFGLSVDGSPEPFASLTVGQPVWVREQTLIIGARSAPEVPEVQLDFETAELWDPRPNWLSLRVSLAAASIEWVRLAQQAFYVAPPDSLLAWLTDARLAEAAAQSAGRALAAGLHAGALEWAVRGARGLAGLGRGTTPAGDDFIAGALLAAWAGLAGPEDPAGWGGIAAAAAARTTSLSAAYLRAAARGECAGYWHTFLAALTGPGAALTQAVRGLTQVGHTSGADALAGFLAAVLWG